MPMLNGLMIRHIRIVYTEAVHPSPSHQLTGMMVCIFTAGEWDAMWQECQRPDSQMTHCQNIPNYMYVWGTNSQHPRTAFVQEPGQGMASNVQLWCRGRHPETPQGQHGDQGNQHCRIEPCTPLQAATILPDCPGLGRCFLSLPLSFPAGQGSNCASGPGHL